MGLMTGGTLTIPLQLLPEGGQTNNATNAEGGSSALMSFHELY